MDGQRPSGEIIFNIIYKGIHTNVTIIRENNNIIFGQLAMVLTHKQVYPSTIIINIMPISLWNKLTELFKMKRLMFFSWL